MLKATRRFLILLSMFVSIKLTVVKRTLVVIRHLRKKFSSLLKLRILIRKLLLSIAVVNNTRKVF